MSDWLALPDTYTSTGHAREFAIEGFQFRQRKMCCIAAERQGGGDDAAIPRFAMGIGANHGSARRALEETITSYDPAGRVVFKRA